AARLRPRRGRRRGAAPRGSVSWRGLALEAPGEDVARRSAHDRALLRIDPDLQDPTGEPNGHLGVPGRPTLGDGDRGRRAGARAARARETDAALPDDEVDLGRGALHRELDVGSSREALV